MKKLLNAKFVFTLAILFLCYGNAWTTIVPKDLGMGATETYTICEGDRISLEGSTINGVEGAWLDTDRNIIQNWTAFPAGRYLQNQSPTDNITYYFVARNGTNTDEQRFDIIVKKIIRFVPVITSVIICSVGASEMITTNVTEPLGETMNYNWYVDGVLKSTGPEFELIGQVPKTGGTIEIHAPTTATHCESRITIPYMVSQVKIISANWQETFCPGEPVILEAVFEEQPVPTVLTYQWYENNIPIEPTDTGTYAMKSFNPTASTIYKLEVTNAAGCSDYVQKTISMMCNVNIPEKTVHDRKIIAYNNTVKVDGIVEGEVISIYNLLGVKIHSQKASQNPEYITIFMPGIYTVIIEGTNVRQKVSMVE